MTIKQFTEFSILCKMLGLYTLAEVDAYIKGQIDILQINPIGINGVEANDKDLAELIRRVALGKELAVARRYNGFVYITTRG